MRRKPMTFAVAVLVFLLSGLSIAGPAQFLSRLSTKSHDEQALTGGPGSGQQLAARLPQAGQVDHQLAAQVIVELTAIASPLETFTPSPPTRPAPIDSTATSSPLPTAIDVAEIGDPVTAAPPQLGVVGQSPALGLTSGAAALTPTESAPTAAPSFTATIAPTATLAATQTPPAPTAPAPTPTASPLAVPTPAAPAPTAAPQPQPGVPDRIVAKAIGLDSKIIPIGWHVIVNSDGSKSAEWNVAEYAVSWHKTSAKLGEIGNTVLTGHNNIVGEVFRHLDGLKIGDPITIYSGQQAFEYKVADRFIVQEVGVPYEQRLENAKSIERSPDERVTLMSCYPYTGDTHRIFIILKPAA